MEKQVAKENQQAAKVTKVILRKALKNILSVRPVVLPKGLMQ